MPLVTAPSHYALPGRRACTIRYCGKILRSYTSRSQHGETHIYRMGTQLPVASSDFTPML